MTEKLRILVDTNVLISAAVWPRFPYEIFRHAVVGDITIVMCPYIIAEAHRHLSRRFAESLDRFAELLGICNYTQIPNPTKDQVRSNRHLVRDPDDVLIALAAINAGVDWLVTSDRDFLDGDTRLLKVITPGGLLHEHLGWPSEQLQAVSNRNWDAL